MKYGPRWANPSLRGARSVAPEHLKSSTHKRSLVNSVRIMFPGRLMGEVSKPCGSCNLISFVRRACLPCSHSLRIELAPTISTLAGASFLPATSSLTVKTAGCLPLP